MPILIKSSIVLFMFIFSNPVFAMRLSGFHVECSSSVLQDETVHDLKASVLTYFRDIKPDELLAREDQILRQRFLTEEYRGLDKTDYQGARKLFMNYMAEFELRATNLNAKLAASKYTSILERLGELEEAMGGLHTDVPVNYIVAAKEIVFYKKLQQEILSLFESVNKNLREMHIRKLALEDAFVEAGLGSVLFNKVPMNHFNPTKTQVRAYEEYTQILGALGQMNNQLKALIPIYVNLVNLAAESEVKVLH